MSKRGLSNSDVAEVAGTTREAVRLWRAAKRRPGIAVVKTLTASRLAIPRNILRPDLWPPRKRAAASTGGAENDCMAGTAPNTVFAD